VQCCTNFTGSALPVPYSTTQCAQILGNATNRVVPPFYSHSIIFGVAATPKDVQVFKYYCTRNFIAALIEEESVKVNIFI